MDLMLLVGTVVIAGMYWRERRTAAHLRRKLSTIEQCHSEAVGACVSLTEELDELTAKLAARDHELSAFYAEEERRVERERAVSAGYAGRMN